MMEVRAEVLEGDIGLEDARAQLIERGEVVADAETLDG